MNSSIIGKIEKARRYAQEPERIKISALEATFHGEHNDYSLTLSNGRWTCSCEFFAGWDMCSHTMALQKVLSQMLPEAALASVAPNS